MANAPSLCKQLANIGISAPYASQISRGVRDPSLALALRIYSEIGIKLGPIKNATNSEIAALKRMAARAA
jgi:hypothetical protein